MSRAGGSAWRASACLALAVAASPATLADEASAADGVHVAEEARGAATVRVVARDGRYGLTVDGRAFVVRGAGLEGRDDAHVETLAAALAAAGGNAFRTWGAARIDVALAAAARHHLMVLVGLDVATEVAGFDYADAAAVARQHANVVAFVERYRDHPNVLGWIVGNEPNLAFGPDGAARAADPRAYDAIGAIVRAIHARDPAHPATVAFAFTATLVADVRTALERVPALDFVSFQGYGALPAIPEAASAAAPERAFMITEFGPLGHWEMPATNWGREIEEPSGVKADGIVQRMTPAVTDDPTGRLLGAFAFLWGQKQERTPTWYGLFTADGGRTAAIDELTRLWTGRYPANRAPRARAITLDGRAATASVRLAPGARALARVDVDDPDGDPLTTRWELRGEVAERSDGGLFEAAPDAVPLDAVRADGGAVLELAAPSEPGQYRLFAYTADGQGGVATANLPFVVAGEGR